MTTIIYLNIGKKSIKINNFYKKKIRSTIYIIEQFLFLKKIINA